MQRFVNYLLGILGSMFNAPIAICLTLLVAIMSALAYGLKLLSQAIGLPSYMAFCVATFALLVMAGYAFDHWQQRSRQ